MSGTALPAPPGPPVHMPPVCVWSAMRSQITAFRLQPNSRTLAHSGWAFLRERNRCSQLEKHLEPTWLLSKHVLGAPSVGGTVVGVRQGAVPFTGEHTILQPHQEQQAEGGGPQGKCVLKTGLA